MPCTYYTADEERALAINRYQKELNSLTHENDMLREALMVAVSGGEIDPDFLKTVYKNQVKHRKEDLKRLQKTFTESKDAEKLGLVMLADPTKPLEPQLGFDPDAY